MGLDRLDNIMKRLRDRETGCEWDSVQTFETIAPYTIEEAYEVADAIHRGDMDALVDEPRRSPAPCRVLCPNGRGSRPFHLGRRARSHFRQAGAASPAHLRRRG